MRQFLALPAIALLTLAGQSAFADILINNSDSGWVTDSGSHTSGNQNYVTGQYSGISYADYLSFHLSGLTGMIGFAQFNVFTYDISAPGMLDLYATSLTPAEVNSTTGTFTPATYTAILTSPVIGTAALDPSESFGPVSIVLNAAGRSWLQSNEGGDVVLGGYYNSGAGNYAFGFSQWEPTNNLDVITVTPEPGFSVLVCALFVGLAAFAMRRRAASQSAV